MTEVTQIVDPLADMGINPRSGSLGGKYSVNLKSKSIFDLVIDIGGIFFPLRTANYSKNMAVDEEYGTGSRLPYWLTPQQIGFALGFSYVSLVLDGDPQADQNSGKGLLLTRILDDQGDEGKPNFFNVMVMDRVNEGGSAQYADFIEALLYSRSTSVKRDIPENKSMVTSREAKSMYKIPA